MLIPWILWGSIHLVRIFGYDGASLEWFIFDKNSSAMAAEGLQGHCLLLLTTFCKSLRSSVTGEGGMSYVRVSPRQCRDSGVLNSRCPLHSEGEGGMYSIVRKKVTVMLSTSGIFLARAGAGAFKSEAYQCHLVDNRMSFQFSLHQP